MRRLPALALAALAAAAASPAATEELTVEAVVERYAAARGGVARWQRLRSLELTGTYAAFSYRHPFTLIRARPDLYRLDFTLLDRPAVRARDAQGPWWLHRLLQPEAARIEDGPYRGQLEREATFEPPLLAAAGRGIAVSLLGPGEIDGVETVDVELTFPGGAREVWHLDAASWLEVAVDSEVVDHTQGAAPIRQRAFYDDFREVDGVVLPFLVEIEFGARLESMAVESVRLDPDLDPARFSPPATAAPVE